VKLSSTRLFPLLLMLALAGATFWLERAVRDEERPHPSLRRHDPDYVVDNIKAVRFGPGGRPESTLAAAKMVHFPDDDTTELLAPRVEQSKPDEPRITVSAERGALSRDGDEVFLYDNVQLVREATRGRAEMQMRTSFLHVVRARSLVRTDREVQITEGGRELSGRGMEYHNDSVQLFLREDVRARFAPAAQ
jgi:lipopolysaccharide export system protein LptC